MNNLHRNPKKTLARLVSNLLSPLFLPIPVYFYATMRLDSNASQHLMVMSVVTLFFCVIPLLALMAMKQVRKIDSIDIRERTARNRPYVYGLMSMTIGLLLFRFLPLQNEHLYAVLAIVPLINGMIAALINLRWKISIHAMGMASSAVAIFFLSGPVVIGWPPLHTQSVLLAVFLLSLLLLVQWARVRLEYHSVAQVLAGGVFATISTIVQLHILLPKSAFVLLT